MLLVGGLAGNRVEASGREGPEGVDNGLGGEIVAESDPPVILFKEVPSDLPAKLCPHKGGTHHEDAKGLVVSSKDDMGDEGEDRTTIEDCAARAFCWSAFT